LGVLRVRRTGYHEFGITPWAAKSVPILPRRNLDASSA
jgi:hypothetical protein